jgi:aminopeptidase N
MGKLTDIVNKGVRLIVTDSAEAAAASAEASPEREIPPAAFEDVAPPRVARSSVAASVDSFEAVYEEAGIALPPHKYGVDKVSEMLESKRLASLGREVKATAVLAALEAAQVPIRDVIQDAVLRDKALDEFEAAKETEVRELKAKSEARIAAVKDEIDALLRAKNSEIEELKKAAEAAEQAFADLQLRKRKEEDRLHEVVSHFIEGPDNPITTARRAASPAPPKPDRA